ncbi:hypothetical protein VMCG_05590 [Cytospora schulzeri]|uniref:Ecp2 effector protein domain-containing protein n=1 Tax=Cytospora schulzeri TaxID=448051 RepID=A0A423WFH7_9PEZI|nr:hypothetical protein VMCG_05590 [Valsa malicola]
MRTSAALIFFSGLVASVYAHSADEYTTEDCSGDASYAHSPNSFFGDTEITIDDTTMAVKTEATLDSWSAYAEKTDDGDCAGDLLGNLDNNCHPVDTFIEGRRINCVKLEINAMGRKN